MSVKWWLQDRGEGIDHWFGESSDGRSISLDQQSRSEVDRLLKTNKEIRNTREIVRTDEEMLRPVAAFPLTIRTNWRREWERKFSDDWSWGTYLRLKINSPDYAQFRQIDGTVESNRALGAAFAIARHSEV